MSDGIAISTGFKDSVSNWTANLARAAISLDMSGTVILPFGPHNRQQPVEPISVRGRPTPALQDTRSPANTEAPA